MRVKEIKKGETYAYIPRYDEYTRRAVCFDLPDSNPITILDVKKVAVDDGMDACGRPNNRRKTVLVYKHYKINAANMLALDLDIVEDKHPELVVQEEGLIEPKEVVWEWDKEVAKVRQDHAVKKEMDKYYDYLEGLNYFVLGLLVKRYGFDKVKPGLEGKKTVRRIELCRTCPGTSQFKNFLYDLYTGFDDAPSAIGVFEKHRERFGRYGHFDDIAPIVPNEVGLHPFLKVEQYLLYGGKKTTEESEFRITTRYHVDFLHAVYRRFRLVTAVKELNSMRHNARYNSNWPGDSAEIKAKVKSIRDTIHKGWLKLSLKQRIGLVIDAINLTGDKVARDFPGTVVRKFHPDQSGKNSVADWKEWKDAQHQRLLDLLPEVQDPRKND